MRRLLVQSLLALLLVVAGCTSKPATTNQAPPPPSATYTDETGGIEGVVVDDELVPVGAASITVIGTNKTATTTDTGRFAIGDLLPAQYLLIIKRSGFKERQFGAEVPVGNVTKVQIVLERVPAPVPHADASYSFTNFLRNAYSYRLASASGNNSGYDAAAAPEAYRSFPTGQIFAKPGWQTLLVEAAWGTSSPSDEMSLRMTFPQKIAGSTSINSGDMRWVTGGKESLRWRIDKEQLQAMGEQYTFDSFYGTYWRIAPDTNPTLTSDYSFHVEKKYTLYATWGINGVLDGNYTRLPG